MSCSNQIICYTSPHLSLHVPFFFLLIILTHCYVIVYSFYYPPLQAYLQYKKSLSNIIHLSHRKIQIFTHILSLYHPFIKPSVTLKIPPQLFPIKMGFYHFYYHITLWESPKEFSILLISYSSLCWVET